MEQKQRIIPIPSDIDQSLAQLKLVTFAVSTVGFALAAANAVTISGPGNQFYVWTPAVGALMVLIGDVTMLFDARVGTFWLKASAICIGSHWLFCTLCGAALPLTTLWLLNSLAENKPLYVPGILFLNAWLPLPA